MNSSVETEQEREGWGLEAGAGGGGVRSSTSGNVSDTTGMEVGSPLFGCSRMGAALWVLCVLSRVKGHWDGL